jgi:membrane associated rhomboid family serine protease
MTDHYHRPASFNILPPVIKNLLITNGLVFLAMLTPYVSDFGNRYLPLFYFEHPYFIPTQLITYQFVHAGFGHLFFNLFALWMFGSSLENLWGSKKMIFFYLISGVGSGLFHMIYTWIQLYYIPGSSPGFVLVGASGAIYGLLLAYAFLFPDNYIYLYFFIPLKAKFFVMILIALDLFGGIFSPQSSNIAHFAHIGGALTGLVILLIWKNSHKLWSDRL